MRLRLILGLALCAVISMGALYGGLDRTKNLSDLDSASTALENLGITSLAAELDYVDVTPGTLTASKAVVVNASSRMNALQATNIDAGYSGAAGTVDVFPATASKGKLQLTCTDQTGDTTVTLDADAMGQATTVNIADPGAAATYMVQSTLALTLAEADILDGATLTTTELNYVDTTAGTPTASKAIVLDAYAEMNDMGVIKSADLYVAAADVVQLNGTPITVLAAVGANVYAEFLGAFVFLDHGGTDYVTGAGEDIQIQNLSAGTAVSHSADGDEFDTSGDALVWLGPKAAEASETTTMIENGGFEVAILVGEWATGDGDLKIRVYYRTIRKPDLEAIS